MKFTVLGASGFIGSHLAAHLRQQGYDCFTPERNDPAIFTEDLGHVIYCIGLTADFRQRPFDAVRAHVCVLADVLEKARYESFLYLSSTRVYQKAQSTNEDTMLQVDPQDFSDLYNLTKLTGESLCFATGRPTVRVARLSNVYGADFTSDNFLSSVISDAVERKRVLLHTSLDSQKDYVSISEVVNVLPRIATSGKYRVYNVASGRNVSNRDLFERLQALTQCSVDVNGEALTVKFPVITAERVNNEFGFASQTLPDSLDNLVRTYESKVRS